MAHVSGKKFGKHSTVIDEIENQVRRLSDMSVVSKIACGVIKHTPNRGGGLKLKITQEYVGVIQLTIRYNSTVQRLYIHSTMEDEVIAAIKQLFQQYIVVNTLNTGQPEEDAG